MPTTTKSKLEREMERRQRAEARADAKSARIAERARKREDRENELGRNKAFNRLFRRLKCMTKFSYNSKASFGSKGWWFEYHGEKYVITFEHWEHQPYGIDDYYEDGWHWVLTADYACMTRNDMNNNSVILGDGYDADKADYTEKVLSGLAELEGRRTRPRYT